MIVIKCILLIVIVIAFAMGPAFWHACFVVDSREESADSCLPATIADDRYQSGERKEMRKAEAQHVPPVSAKAGRITGKYELDVELLTDFIASFCGTEVVVEEHDGEVRLVPIGNENYPYVVGKTAAQARVEQNSLLGTLVAEPHGDETYPEILVSFEKDGKNIPVTCVAIWDHEADLDINPEKKATVVTIAYKDLDDDENICKVHHYGRNAP